MNKADEKYIERWEHTSSGIFPLFENIDMKDYKSLNASLHETGCGKLPILFLTDRKEFEMLLLAIFHRSEDETIPSFVNAITLNDWWDISRTPHTAIIITNGYYANLSYQELWLSEEEWLEKSRILRINHEGAYYCMNRMEKDMSNPLKNRIIADAIGIIAAFGEYKPDVFFRIMGLEFYPLYRKGGQLEEYLSSEIKDEDDEWESSFDFHELKKETYNSGIKILELMKENPISPEITYWQKEFIDLYYGQV